MFLKITFLSPNNLYETIWGPSSVNDYHARLTTEESEVHIFVLAKAVMGLSPSHIRSEMYVIIIQQKNTT